MKDRQKPLFLTIHLFFYFELVLIQKKNESLRSLEIFNSVFTHILSTKITNAHLLNMKLYL